MTTLLLVAPVPAHAALPGGGGAAEGPCKATVKVITGTAGDDVIVRRLPRAGVRLRRCGRRAGARHYFFHDNGVVVDVESIKY